MGTEKLDLARAEFHKTDYPSVVYLVSAARTPDGKPARVFYIRYRDPSGRQRFEKAGKFATTAARANTIRTARASGKELPNRERREAKKAEKKAEAGRWTFSKLFDAYMESKGNYPRRSVDAGNFRKHLRDALGDKEPAQLDALAVDRIRVRMLKTYKPGTVNAVLGFLVRLSSFGVKRRLCEGIRFHVERPKDGALKTEQMSDEQMAAYLKAASMCGNKMIGAFLMFELLTGMRFNEARGLTWSAVDLQHGAVHIRNPKGGKDQFIPLNDAARELLRKLPRDSDNPFVFQGATGGRLGTSTVLRHGRAIAKAAGLPKGFRPNHGLRHSFASALASSGEVDLLTLSRLLTHKSTKVTERYSHLTQQTLRRASDVMSRVMSDIEQKEAKP